MLIPRVSRFSDLEQDYARSSIPVSSENGDSRPPFSYEVRDPSPNILGTLGSPISYDIRDPSIKLGTPIFFSCLTMDQN